MSYKKTMTTAKVPFKKKFIVHEEVIHIMAR